MLGLSKFWTHAGHQQRLKSQKIDFPTLELTPNFPKLSTHTLFKLCRTFREKNSSFKDVFYSQIFVLRHWVNLIRQQWKLWRWRIENAPTKGNHSQFTNQSIALIVYTQYIHHRLSMNTDYGQIFSKQTGKISSCETFLTGRVRTKLKPGKITGTIYTMLVHWNDNFCPKAHSNLYRRDKNITDEEELQYEWFHFVLLDICFC